ncbi:MAG TPA: hypothetical protein VHH36_03450 [Candidatus Thermoplasmatota archaeon]|nr:hypothetical protein [Candidatus Thermoplasmatota archaeon]
MFLADATSEALTPASVVVSLAVAFLAAVLVALALGAARKRQNPGLRWVAAAFAVLCAKNVFSAFNVQTHVVPHDAIELVLSVADLAVLLLLFLPLYRRKRG